MKKIQLKQVLRNKRFVIIHHYFTHKAGISSFISFKKEFRQVFY